MPFEPKPTRNKREMMTKSLYISAELVEQLNEMASQHDTSFNNLVISMIEYCLNEESESKKPSLGGRWIRP